MRLLSRLLLVFIILVPVALVVAAFMAVEREPAVSTGRALSAQDVERARRILAAHDPRRLQEGERRLLVLSETDLKLLADYLSRRSRRLAAGVELAEGQMRVRASLRLPSSPLGQFVNLDLVLGDTEPFPVVQSFHVGSVPVPAWIAKRLLQELGQRLIGERGYGAALDTVREITAGPQRIAIVYQWRDELYQEIQAQLVSQPLRRRIVFYHQRLVHVLSEVGRREVPMTGVLASLLDTTPAEDAVLDNQAWLMVLSAHVNGRDLSTLVPALEGRARPVRRTLLLRGREDLAQHFLSSAALTALGSEALSDAVGLYKEVQDSRGGSGFSFTDLLADRAGTRFGILASASESGARRLRAKLAAGVSGSELLPRTEDLAEFMSEQEFKRRFGGVGAPAYEEMRAEIERRIAALPLYGNRPRPPSGM